jgi:hypothetical protein
LGWQRPGRGICHVAAQLLLVGLAELGSAQTVPSDEARLEQIFFESTQSHRQTVQLMGELEVVVESSLADPSVIVQRGDVSEVVLDITGSYRVTGYYGFREHAGVRELAGPELAFRTERGPNTLELSSPEWIWLHHDLLIVRLTVTIPEDAWLTFHLLRIPRDLYGRR